MIWDIEDQRLVFNEGKHRITQAATKSAKKNLKHRDQKGEAEDDGDGLVCLYCQEGFLCEKHPYRRKNLIRAIADQIKNSKYRRTLYDSKATREKQAVFKLYG